MPLHNESIETRIMREQSIKIKELKEVITQREGELARLNSLLEEGRVVYEKWAEIEHPDGDEFIEFWEDAWAIFKKWGGER